MPGQNSVFLVARLDRPPNAWGRLRRRVLVAAPCDPIVHPFVLVCLVPLALPQIGLLHDSRAGQALIGPPGR